MISDSTQKTAAEHTIAPKKAENTNYSHYFGAGLVVLCWRCWERALWWSLSLWSEEQETQHKSARSLITSQSKACRNLNMMYNLLLELWQFIKAFLDTCGNTENTLLSGQTRESNVNCEVFAMPGKATPSLSRVLLSIQSSHPLPYQQCPQANLWKEWQVEELPTSNTH